MPNDCQKHWDMQREAIKAKGMYHLVHKGGEQAMKHVLRQLKGEDKEQDFDPLLAANNAIFVNALNAVGLQLMVPDDSGKLPCPICLVIKTCKCGDPKCASRVEGWTEFAANDVLEECKRRGLVPSA